MKKLRIVSLFLVIVLSLSVFTGCKNKSVESNSSTEKTAKKEKRETQEPKETVILKMWGGVPAEKGPEAVCAKFNELYKDKGIQVEYERYVNDDSGNVKLETALLSGQDVDLYMTYVMGKAVKRVNANMLLDLSEYIERDKFDLTKGFGEVVESYYVDDKPYMIPTTKGFHFMILNKKMFDDAGIPIPTDWTVDEFREIAKKLTKGEGTDKIYGAFLPTNLEKRLSILYAGTKLGSNPMYKDDQDKESNFDHPDIKKTLQVFIDMMETDKSTVPHVDIVTQKLTAQNMFVGGKVAISEHFWILRDIKDKEKYPHDFVTAFAPVPKVDKDQKDYYAIGGLGDYLGINPKSKYKDEAWEFMKWYATEGMMPLAEFGRMPSYSGFDKEALANVFVEGCDDLFDIQSYKEVVLKDYDKMQVPSVQNKRPEIINIAGEEFELAYILDKTVDEALANAKKRADKELSK